MQSLNWQLVVAGEPVQPGANVRVKERWRGADGAFVVLQPPGKETSACFCVRFNVNIGGKNYLLLENRGESQGELTIVRLFEPEKFGAMDPDRFSSLKNALTDYLETAMPTSLDELDKLLGGLEAR